tara:strand:- start:495 stop:1106 length:612 start_codon:yes stop_codon:yes gene_type:complete
MNEISNFNPLKIYDSGKLIEPLYNMLNYVSDDICFYGDETGYFFSPLRRLNNASISFTDENFYCFYSLVKNDLARIRRLYLGYYRAFDVDLIQFYEREAYKDPRPNLRGYYTMILSLLSKNIDSAFCNYIDTYDNRIYDRLVGLNKFNISNNEIYWNELPDNKFIISYEKDFDGNGILLTKKDKEHKLLDEVEGLKYYYVRKK